MPYASNSELPPAVRKAYSGRCQTVFRTAFNDNAGKGEGPAFAIAHTAAKACESGIREAAVLDGPSDGHLDSRAESRATVEPHDGTTNRQDEPATLGHLSGGRASVPTLREAAPTKDGLPASSYAYVPDPKTPTTWKLKLYDASGKPDPDTLPGAAASLSPGGFRGQKADIPSADLPAVKARIRQAYRKWKGSKVEYPDSIKESAIRESGTGAGYTHVDLEDQPLTIREATILLDKSAVCAQVIFAPNGDAYVIPNWDGAFDSAKAPLPTDKPSLDLDDVWDAQDAANLLSRLYGMKGGETDEPDMMALLDKAIAAITAYMKAEGDEIGAPEEPGVAEAAWATVEAALEKLREAGKRNSSADQKRIQGAHDLMHDLGAVHVAGQSYAGMPMAEAKVEIDEGAKPGDIKFTESAYDGSPAMVTLAEAAAQFDDANRIVTITPIRPGWGNARDNFYYPRTTLKEATEEGLFNHIKMFRNHPRRSDEKELPERSVTDWFATTQEARWDDAAGVPRLPIKVHDADAYARFKEAPEQIAFSVLGGGTARPGRVEGKDGRIVEAFRHLRSVDWVTEAGAGGALAFAESAAEEFDMEIEKLTAEQLREGNPELYAEIREAAIKEHDAEAAAAEGEGTAEGEGAAEGAAEGAEAPAEGAAAPEAAATPEAAPEAAPAAEGEGAPVAEGKAPAGFVSRAEFEALQRKIDEPRLREAAQKALEAELAESILPRRAKEIVAETFREAGWGNGYVYTDEPAFRSGVRGELAKAARLLGLAAPTSKVNTPAQAHDEDGGMSAAKLVESRIGDKWGDERIPKADDAKAAAVAEGAPQPATETGNAIADRIAAKF